LTNQMVHTLPIKKTTPITTDMSKSICPKWWIGFFNPYSNWVYFDQLF
jgi:hypothetical protein